MPLDDATFLKDAEKLQEEMMNEIDIDQARKQYAIKLLALVRKYLLSGTVTITGTSNQGAFTGTGKIS